MASIVGGDARRVGWAINMTPDVAINMTPGVVERRDRGGRASMLREERGIGGTETGG